jgi:hypothetical protein
MSVFSLLNLSPRVQENALRGTVIAAVSLASFLSFSVQPLVGKLLLPTQGGAASTWLGTMLYFQIALLLGYGWAVWLLQRRALVQVGATAALGLVAMLASRLGWAQTSAWTGVGGIVGTLSVASLPAMVLLFGTSPLLHGWLGRQNKSVPYHLYAISNAGSLLAVVLYPFTVERSIPVSDQVFYWQGILSVFVGLIGVAGFLFLRTTGADQRPEPTTEKIGVGQVGFWLALSALACVGMLGATHHIAAEIGSSPLSWVGPFGLFLLSFLVTFSGVWQPRYTQLCLGWLAVSLTGFMLTKGVSPSTVDGWVAFWVLSLSASGSFFANGLLHQTRPQQRFAAFYLVLAVGGVAGGLFASFAAPVFFLRPSELLAVSCVLLIVGLLRLVTQRDPITVGVVSAIALSPVLGLVLTQTRDEADGMENVRRFRNVYGYSMLKTDQNGLILSSETTTHGTQITTNADTRRQPTLYYTESSGIGRVITETQKQKSATTTAVVGLGAGTLAAYARPTDAVDFWDIDPKAVHLARDHFTFINDSPGRIRLLETDGRKGLETTTTDYDLIVIDAFTGDAVPPHLLTREALGIYSRRLEKRHGLLAIHVSSRYQTLFPVIAATANTLGLHALRVVTDIAHTTETTDWDCTSSQYILVGRAEQIHEALAWLPAEEDEGRVRRTVNIHDPLPPGQAVIWTDERNAALDALNLKNYLLGK